MNAAETNYSRMGDEFGHLLAVLESSDGALRVQATVAVATLCKALEGLTGKRSAMRGKNRPR